MLLNMFVSFCAPTSFFSFRKTKMLNCFSINFVGCAATLNVLKPDATICNELWMKLDFNKIINREEGEEDHPGENFSFC